MNTEGAEPEASDKLKEHIEDTLYSTGRFTPSHASEVTQEILKGIVSEPSESQEETAEYLLTRWREIYKEEDIKYDEDYHDAADVNILMSRTLVRFVKELQEKFHITRRK